MRPEGVVSSYVSPDSKTGVIAEVNCETDFVAKTDDFKALVDTVAKLVAEQDPQDVDALMALDTGDGTVAEMITRAVAKIGEKITIRRFARSHVEGGMVDCYVHLGVRSGCWWRSPARTWPLPSPWPMTSPCTLPLPSPPACPRRT